MHSSGEVKPSKRYGKFFKGVSKSQLQTKPKQKLSFKTAGDSTQSAVMSAPQPSNGTFYMVMTAYNSDDCSGEINFQEVWSHEVLFPLSEDCSGG